MAAAGQTLFNELRMFFPNGAQLTQVNREDIKRVSGLCRIRVRGGVVSSAGAAADSD